MNWLIWLGWLLSAKLFSGLNSRSSVNTNVATTLSGTRQVGIKNEINVVSCIDGVQIQIEILEKCWCTADTDIKVERFERMPFVKEKHSPFVREKHVSCFSLKKGLRCKRWALLSVSTVHQPFSISIVSQHCLRSTLRLFEPWGEML